MSHQVEKLFSVKQVPWHGLGKILDAPPTIEEGIDAAGLNWRVGLHPLQTEGGVKTPFRGIIRESDNKVLGVAGKDYHPLQNIDAFKFFQPFLDAEEATLETAGSLAGGTKVWVLASIKRDNMEIAKNDDVKKFVLLASGHDAKTSVKIAFTPIRVVCINTLAMAVRDKASQLLRMRHSASVVANLDKVRDIINLADQQFEATAEQYRHLAGKSFNQADLMKFVKIIVGVKEGVKVSTRTTNIMEKIMQLVEAGQGNSNPAVKGTWWAAYNGANEYLNYNVGRTPDNRMNSLWFGQGAIKNKLAFDTAMALAV